MATDYDYGIYPVTVLHGHTSQETAYVVDDYPYGYRLRCKIRYWIETATKGAKKGQQRFMSQTTNPKKDGEVWNAPKGSTYLGLIWMYLDQNGHVQYTGVGLDFGVSPAQYDRYRLSGLYDGMTEEERKLYDGLVMLSRKYEEPWNDWAELVELVRAYHAEHGKLPEYTNGTFELDRLRYVPEHEWPVVVALVKAG